MAGTSLLALIDDIASILDDVATLTKVAVKKTSGVLGDDLALNAQQVTGIKASRELPVIWAVAKGSFKNKLILVPTALLISAVLPWAILPLLMFGGAFLCYEGVEKLAHKLQGNLNEEHLPTSVLEVSLTKLEAEKITGAIRTDFILSAEIIVITLGTIVEANFLTQVAVLSGIAMLMTLGVYGLLAGIVKLDDAGLHLIQKSGSGLIGSGQRMLGRKILAFAPLMMKSLSVIGTAAMFMVGGSIVVHGVSDLHHLVQYMGHQASIALNLGMWIETLVVVVLDALVGVLVGIASLALVGCVQRIRRR